MANVLINYSGHMDWRCAMFNLFERRLGYTVYCPNGSKKWKKQFGITQPPHNSIYFDPAFYQDEIKYIPVRRDKYNLKLITPEQFHEIDFKLVLVGNGKSELPFLKLVKKHKKKAVFIRQIANLLEVPKQCKNILLTTRTKIPAHINFFKHKMEPPSIFHPVEHNGEKIIKSYSNFLRRNKINSSLWDQAQASLPDFKFYMHGAKNDDGWIDVEALDQSMKKSMFIWHTKAAGGGGFCLQEALACGKPVIVKTEYSKKMKTGAQDYLCDGINCIDLSIRSLNTAIDIINHWSEPEMYKKKCNDVIKHYKKYFDFELEAKKIASWIDTLKPGE